MRRSLSTFLAFAITGAAVLSTPAMADPRYHGGYQDRRDYEGDRGDYHGHERHRDRGWHRGDRIGEGEWRRYQRIDYRQYRLRRPPRGYEWRMVGSDYVLAALATGLIAEIVAGHGRSWR